MAAAITRTGVCASLVAVAILAVLAVSRVDAAGPSAPSRSDGAGAPAAADPIVPPGKAAAGPAIDGAVAPRHHDGYATPGSQLLDWLGPIHEMTPGERLLSVTADDSFEDPINWNVTVFKSRHQVAVYYKGRSFKTYHAVFGYHADGAKRWEGDLRTPEGVYAIIGKYHHPRWKYFLRLNYPNFVDRRNFKTMLQDHVVPVVRGQHRAVGGAVGIHGTDRPRFNRDEINWTRGCISVDNDAIVELYHLLPVDTLVIIKP